MFQNYRDSADRGDWEEMAWGIARRSSRGLLSPPARHTGTLTPGIRPGATAWLEKCVCLFLAFFGLADHFEDGMGPSHLPPMWQLHTGTPLRKFPTWFFRSPVFCVFCVPSHTLHTSWFKKESTGCVVHPATALQYVFLMALRVGVPVVLFLDRRCRRVYSYLCITLPHIANVVYQRSMSLG